MPDEQGHATAEDLERQRVQLDTLIAEAKRLRVAITEHLQQIRRSGKAEQGAVSRQERRRKPR